MKENKLIKKADIRMIADKGKAIYKKIKAQYDPKERGKFLAVNIDTEEVFLGNTSIEALNLAEKKYPDTVFYVQKVGFDSAESIARYYKLM